MYVFKKVRIILRGYIGDIKFENNLDFLDFFKENFCNFGCLFLVFLSIFYLFYWEYRIFLIIFIS